MSSWREDPGRRRSGGISPEDFFFLCFFPPLRLILRTLPMKPLDPSCAGRAGIGGRSSALSVGVGVENTLEEDARPNEDPYDACRVPMDANLLFAALTASATPLGTCIEDGRLPGPSDGFPSPMTPDAVDDPSPVRSLLLVESSGIPLAFRFDSFPPLLGVVGTCPMPLPPTPTPGLNCA